jgi:divalent metal cation (Fe/Co/Zn/Cd) transporter
MMITGHRPYNEFPFPFGFTRLENGFRCFIAPFIAFAAISISETYISFVLNCLPTTAIAGMMQFPVSIRLYAFIQGLPGKFISAILSFMSGG